MEMAEFAHFLAAQSPVYATALAELRAGRKATHWMWFIFPQLQGLGASAMSRRFALGDLGEARAYLAHPVLGARLRECTAAVLDHRGQRTAHEIFSSPDDLKFRSSMTLFGLADPSEPLFRDALAHFYGGKPDPRTLALLGL
ncbi:MAG TPA: DUF1810 domain-containing protein [Paracoccaceae bacterium]|nr:DUF1810 domain-containing protein [Paracoccaceae bacterium]